MLVNKGSKTMILKIYIYLLVTLGSLHRDIRGDNENLGRLLILALILVPLVILLVMFGGQILNRAGTEWNKLGV